MHREESSLAARLDRLAGELASMRRENRLLKLVVAVIALAMVGSYALARSSPRAVASAAPAKPAGTIVAGRLEIVDGAGKVRATLESEEKEGVALKMFDRGRIRAEHRVWGNGIPATIYYQEDGKQSVVIWGGELEPSLKIFDRSETPRLELTNVGGTPQINLNDADGNTVMGLGMIGKAPHLTTYRDGRPPTQHLATPR